ncbi:MAG TPA: DUF4355 domain-containing protein [Candidatus Limiplasma sp.]|nr:DUF4355 domain-containing protein [Candidatus Limiplasma sp.]HRX07690.1 DUF4355 domain-containing protein [Candidatus Limiplasma sp.]
MNETAVETVDQAQETAEAAKAETAEKTFTQDDINRIVSQTIASERKKAEAQLIKAKKEAEELALMTAEQRAEHRMAEREAALAEREDTLRRSEVRAGAVQLLLKKGLPAGLADTLAYADADSASAAIDTLEQAFRTALQQGIEERMKGMAPAASVSTAAGFESKLKKAVGIQ